MDNIKINTNILQKIFSFEGNIDTSRYGIYDTLSFVINYISGDGVLTVDVYFEDESTFEFDFTEDQKEEIITNIKTEFFKLFKNEN